MKRIVGGRRAKRTKLRWAKGHRHRMTKEERIIWQHLRAHRLEGFHFRRQQVISGYIVDFYCHKARLVVEIDGPIHASQIEYDAHRDQVLSALGLKILRIKNSEVHESLPQALALIESHLHPHPHSSPPTDPAQSSSPLSVHPPANSDLSRSNLPQSLSKTSEIQPAVRWLPE